MKNITTADGARIKVEEGTDDATIALLKTAPVVKFSEFVYTGNSRNGHNSGNYEDLERFFVEAGLAIQDDDLTMLIDDIHETTGVASLVHRGKRLRYQDRKSVV